MYYCKNCGEAYATDEAVMCVKCGVAKGQGNSYCHNCGNPVSPEATVCLTCGVANKPAASAGAKSKLVAGLLGIFLGAFGVHNFYLGYTKKAVIQLVCSVVGMILSCIVIGAFLVLGIEIWGLVEGIMILTGKIAVDGNGLPLTD
ncbi:MAG: NINE protein [Roseburia sp.]|nr:NINE protein [Roseburia sp.]